MGENRTQGYTRRRNVKRKEARKRKLKKWKERE